MSATMGTAIDPGVYQMNWRGLRLSECWRFGKGWMFPIALLIKLSGKRGDYMWLPASQSEPPCPRESLSAEALQHLDPEIEKLDGLGYRVISYKKVARNLDPLVKETGGCLALHHDGRRMMHVLYLRRAQNMPNLPPETQVVCPFGVLVAQDGKALSVVNHNNYFDEPSMGRTIQLPGAEIPELAARLEVELGRMRSPARSFDSTDELLALLDERTNAIYASRVRRGLFVRVPPDEERRVLWDAGLSPM